MTDVAVVVFDTLRADTFAEYFDWLPGRRFTNAYSTSHWTVPAHASLLTGKYPSEIGVHVRSRSLDCDTLLPERLQDNGYTTRLWTRNMQIYEWDGWERGFSERRGPEKYAFRRPPENVPDWYAFHTETTLTGWRKALAAARFCFSPRYDFLPSMYEGIRLSNAVPIGSVPSGATLLADRLRATTFDSSEFLLVNLMEMHSRYDPPATHATGDPVEKVEFEDGVADTLSDGETASLRRAYDDCAAYLSDAYREIFAVLSESFDYVITCSDHGELLGEYGHWTHTYGLQPELARVPLVISGGTLENDTVDMPVSWLDLHRTIVELMDVAMKSRGQSLLDPSALTPRDRLIEYHGLAAGRREKFERVGLDTDLFDRFHTQLDGVVTADGDYAYETYDGDLVSGEELSSDVARSKLDALVEQIDREPLDESAENVSDSVKQRLNDLGYAG